MDYARKNRKVYRANGEWWARSPIQQLGPRWDSEYRFPTSVNVQLSRRSVDEVRGSRGNLQKIKILYSGSQRPTPERAKQK